MRPIGTDGPSRGSSRLCSRRGRSLATPRLGGRWLDTAQRWLWNRPFSADDLRSLRAMKQRAEQEVERKGLSERELKLGPGGIRDIEFTVQLLQLVHGHSDRRSSVTDDRRHDRRAGRRGLHRPTVTPTSCSTPTGSSAIVEHRLQLEDEQQVHALPSCSEATDRLAASSAIATRPTPMPSEQLLGDLRSRRLAVRGIHERIYFRPLARSVHRGAEWL